MRKIRSLTGNSEYFYGTVFLVFYLISTSSYTAFPIFEAASYNIFAFVILLILSSVVVLLCGLPKYPLRAVIGYLLFIVCYLAVQMLSTAIIHGVGPVAVAIANYRILFAVPLFVLVLLPKRQYFSLNRFFCLQLILLILFTVSVLLFGQSDYDEIRGYRILGGGFNITFYFSVLYIYFFFQRRYLICAISIISAVLYTLEVSVFRTHLLFAFVVGVLPTFFILSRKEYFSTYTTAILFSCIICVLFVGVVSVEFIYQYLGEIRTNLLVQMMSNITVLPQGLTPEVASGTSVGWLQGYFLSDVGLLYYVYKNGIIFAAIWLFALWRLILRSMDEFPTFAERALLAIIPSVFIFSFFWPVIDFRMPHIVYIICLVHICGQYRATQALTGCQNFRLFRQ